METTVDNFKPCENCEKKDHCMSFIFGCEVLEKWNLEKHMKNKAKKERNK